ncbi:MAG: hypothetical protein ACI97A_003365 [Planctomycetota bacterium]|jgi:hypothetical protein
MTTMKLMMFLNFAVLFAGIDVAAQNKTDNEVVAIVNKTVLTSYDVHKSLKKAEIDLSSMANNEQEYEFNTRLTTMVRQALRAEAAEKSGVAVSEEELENRKIKKIEEMGGEAAFEDFLRGKGQSINQYETEFQQQQEQSAWLRVVSGRGGARLSRDLRPLYNVAVTPNEMRKFYKKNLKTQFTTKNEAQIRVIQVYFRKATRGERRVKKRLLQGLKQKLKTKADFAVLAEKHSAHGTQKQGGLIKSVEKGKGALVPEAIEDAVFLSTATPGSILGPIEDVNSYWLVKVEKKVEARTVPFSEAQASIKNFLAQLKVRRAIRAVELELINKAYIYPASLKRMIVRGLEQNK